MAISKAKLITREECSSSADISDKSGQAKDREAIDKYCWNKQPSFYTDYNFKTQKRHNNVTPAGIYPFCFVKEHPDYMSLHGRKAAEVVMAKMLKDGGFDTIEYQPVNNGMRPMDGHLWNG